MEPTSSSSMMPLNFSSDPSKQLVKRPLIPKKLIAKWEIEGKMISLFHESNLKRFVCTDERTGRNTTFKPTLYDISHAVSLISMFQKTIGMNLERCELNSACFLPKLCIEANHEPGIQVALFGFLDTRNNPQGEVKWLQWGVFHHSTKEEETFECKGARTFLQNAPTTNRPDIKPKVDEKGQPVLDKRGKQILEEGPNHYAMTAYSKRFGVRLTRNAEDQRIEKVALHYVSLLDKNVLLDRDNWAVTLVSAMRSSETNWFLRLFGEEDVGHAMLACEGVEENKPFLRYIHFTQEPREKNPELKKNEEAQIESFEKKDRDDPLKVPIPLKTLNGPTWRRPRIFVQKMFDLVQRVKKKPYKFALYGELFLIPHDLNKGAIMAFSDASAMDAIPAAMESRNSKYDIPHTCLGMACWIASKCGIIFQPEARPRTPIEKIEMLNSAPILLIPSGVDPKYLGPSFTHKYKDLSDQMLSSCVILAPADSTPEDLERWVKQPSIEELKLIDSLDTARTIDELFNRPRLKRW